MEQNPWSFHKIIRYVLLCVARINEAAESMCPKWSESCPAGTVVLFDKPIDYNTPVNDSREVDFSMTTATKGGFDNKIGSRTMHEPENFSARHQLFNTMIFAAHLIDQALGLKPTVPTSILKRKRRSRSVSPRDRVAVGGLEDVHVIPEHQSIIEAAERKTATTWVVATAAAHHATGNRDLLSGLTPDQPGRFVHPADGAAPMQVVAHGCVITNTVVLPNVLYVPGLTANLVSASQLAELDYTVGFSRGACHIRSAADGNIVGKASVGESGLFELDFLKVLPSINMPVL